MKDDGIIGTFRFYSFILPGLITLVTFLLLSPILLKKQPIAETLHCKGDLRFFDDPFPETIVEMKHLRRTHKPSKPWTYEDLLYRNMMVRLRNLGRPMFWRLLWERWICRGCSCRHRDKDTKKTTLDYVMVVVWFPVCIILVMLHAVPLFSVWTNYIRKQIKLAFGCSGKKISQLARMLAVPLQLFGIFFFYLMMWNLLVIITQFAAFVFIDVLRNVATTLSKIILILAIFVYLRSAFQDFEDGYRELKSVVISLCFDRVKELEDEDSTVVIKLKPYEPLYVKTKDGEVSIPRRIFYDICKVYKPYRKEVAATFSRLFVNLPW